MTAKEYLNQAYRLNERINCDISELEDLRDMSSRISSCNFEERFSGTRSTEPPFVRYLGKIVEMEQKINAEIDLLVDLKAEIRTAVEQVENINERLVLQYRYIEGMTWERIAERLFADRSTVIRWHRKALKNFAVPEK